MAPALHVVMYHYVRDLPHTDFPRIKGMLTQDFRDQLLALQQCYEMATLESAVAFLQGTYTPARDLCLLTFDDGLRDHYAEVTPLLVQHGIQGIFFVITACLRDHRVLAVHMNHFLMAALDFARYQNLFLQNIQDVTHKSYPSIESYAAVAQQTYRWDTLDVACFKYFVNFVIDQKSRDQVVKALFEEHIAAEGAFASALYLNWEEARQMQAVGMVIGGHSHHHKPLATLAAEESWRDLHTCTSLLTAHLQPQPLWPFSYPYGKKDSFNDTTVQQLKQLGFQCAFSTEVAANVPGQDIFLIHRIDCKDAPSGL